MTLCFIRSTIPGGKWVNHYSYAEDRFPQNVLHNVFDYMNFLFVRLERLTLLFTLPKCNIYLS